MARGHFSKVLPREGCVGMTSGNALIVSLYVAEFHVENYISTVKGLWLRLLLFATHGAPPTTVTIGAGMCLV